MRKEGAFTTSTKGCTTETKETCNTGKFYYFKTIVALLLWLGAIPCNVALLLLAFFILPSGLSVLVLVVLALLMLVSADERSSFGRNVSRFIFRYAFNYFPITLHFEDIKAFYPEQAYVFGYEPHSVFALGTWALTDCAGLMPLPKIKMLASSYLLCIPFQRQIWRWMGLSPVSKKNFYSQLAAGYSCIVVPGGMQEMLHMEHNSEVAFLKSRKGFVKIAMVTGSPLVPIFCFGQSYAFKWWKPDSSIFLKIYRATKFPTIFYWGLFGTPIPFKVPLHIVVGTPIKIKQNAQPTIEEINEAHNKFVASMQELFEKNKSKFGYNELKLKVL
ncbi:hypothetical protein LUZ61_000263 [Rhynchospora tenuis]|uniref:Acyltransferase n=1 Tax=Rhynchospora tenuis TaxID=198213 RepID=A0AAD5ZEU3_9POAL|nr:hypothetical protein LUZ61_000263 [Rhynchospora tenuis]